tara:strand:- start:4460 stop:5683 length:1224 start_codon:yes stop_codon:yes gene_type:complete
MIKYQEFLEESKTDKNLHLEHLEDEVLNNGVDGARRAINFLQSLRDMLAGHSSGRMNITTKWDGAPAIFAGINPENGKFFVGTKGVFAQTPKINYTNADIDKNHPGGGLAQKLKYALKYLPELGIRDVIQGDMMFINADLKGDTIDNERYITFQPNTIVYAVPQNSTLANQITSAKMGIVWHTTYTGKKISDMKASYGVNIGRLSNSKNVWYRDASFVDTSGSATFTKDETAQLTAILSQAGSLFRQISPRTLNTIATNDTYKIPIKTWNNSKVREGQTITHTGHHTRGLIQSVSDKMNASILQAKKTDTRMKRTKEKTIIMSFYRTNAGELKKIFELMNHLTDAKNMIVRKLQQVKDIGTFVKIGDGFKVTSPEGFVAIDHIGNAVKLVDRLEFSHNNFNVVKNWS